MTGSGRNTGVGPRGWFRIRLGCAAASSAVFAFAVIDIGSLTPGYSQWSDPVSRLGSPGEPCALEARAAFAAYGLLVVAGASTLRQYAGHQGHRLARCLALYAAAGVVAGVASKDQPGAALTVVGQVHVAAAVLAGRSHLRAGRTTSGTACPRPSSARSITMRGIG